MKHRLMPFWLSALCVFVGCAHQRRSAGESAGQMSLATPAQMFGDVSALRAAMKTGVDPMTLGDRFRIVQSVHSDYFGPSVEIGGDATSVMNFFFADDGRIYRVHYDRRIVEVKMPPNWVREMRPANQPAGTH